MSAAHVSSISQRVPTTWGNPASWNAAVMWIDSSSRFGFRVRAVEQADR
jgi:hypothetical protein